MSERDPLSEAVPQTMDAPSAQQSGVDAGFQRMMLRQVEEAAENLATVRGLIGKLSEQQLRKLHCLFYTGFNGPMLHQFLAFKDEGVDVWPAMHDGKKSAEADPSPQQL